MTAKLADSGNRQDQLVLFNSSGKNPSQNVRPTPRIRVLPKVSQNPPRGPRRHLCTAALAAGSSAFAKPIQDYVVEVGWGSWARRGLTRQQRSLLNIGILMTQNREAEFRVHIRGAIRNGLSEEEISEAIRHTMVYSGAPAGVGAFKVAGAVIREMKDSGEYRPEERKVKAKL
jgi:4-carboxymuconolactone decarboxylase